MTQAYSEKEILSSPNRSRTYDLPIASSDALPLSYRRLVGAKAIKLQSWPKISGQIRKLNTKYLPVPPPPCNVVKLLCLCTVRLISVAFNIAWGRGGLPKIRNDGTTKLMTTGYRYPEHKCTLQALFSYLSQKILARIVGSCDKHPAYC